MSDPVNPTVLERFRGLLRLDPARVKVRPAPQPAAPSKEEVLHVELHGWAERAPEAFAAHLDEVVEAAHVQAENTRAQHAETNFWLGYERAVRDVRGAFVVWKQSQPNAGNPAEMPEPQGGR